MAVALNFPRPRIASSSISGMALAAAGFALMASSDTIFKLMATGHPPYQILMINGGFSIFPLIVWALSTGGLQRLHTEKPLLHLIRGSVGVLSTYCAIYAYSRLPLASYYAIVFSGPLFVAALSFIWLNEKIDAMGWLLIAIGFLGVLIVTNPRVDAVHGMAATAGRFVALLSVSLYALSVTILRRMRIGESNLAFSFYGFVASTGIGGALLLMKGAPELSAGDFSYLALSGLLSGGASICLMTAYHRSPVAVVAPFQYTQIIWGALAGWLIWRQIPSQRLLAGAAIIAVSGLFLIYREMQFVQGKRRAIRGRS